MPSEVGPAHRRRPVHARGLHAAVAVDRAGVDAAVVNKVRSGGDGGGAGRGQAGKTSFEKIAEGKVNAFFAERVLLEQLHVKTDTYRQNAKIKGRAAGRRRANR